MKSFGRITAVIVLLYIAAVFVMNTMMLSSAKGADGYYRVEVKRLADEINETGTYDLSHYTLLTGVTEITGNKDFSADCHYAVAEAGGKLYRIEYTVSSFDRKVLVIADIFLAAVLIVITVIFRWISRKILRPFNLINKVPQELAKGNLAVPIPEEKGRFFGRFTWGINLLRESIEEQNARELSIQRDKKLLLLSLSHDIKTPLSAIKLNAKALSKGIYKDPERQREAAESINARADEIESYMKQISEAASEDFINFEVSVSEVFIDEIINKANERYSLQLAATETDFTIDRHTNCLFLCDEGKLYECICNIIDNAIKYGDRREIGISFETSDGFELISIRNTGCTLGKEELTQIFESFRRGGNSADIPGSGLGLYICRRIMALMDGDVYASIEDGCFIVTLVVMRA